MKPYLTYGHKQRLEQVYEFDSIGTHWWCEVLGGQGFTDSLRQEIKDYCARFDRDYSRFRRDSLVSQLARTGKLVDPPAEMFEMLTLATEMKQVTRGAFDVLVGNDLSRLGYGVTDYELNATKNEIELSRDEIKVTTGTVLDLGGIGKGWMIDEISKIFRRHGIDQFIVNGGGDLYCQSDGPVEFALEHPNDPDSMMGKVHMKRGALCASSTVKRTWGDGDAKLHHIIDPVTHQPADSRVMATFVLADTAVIADAIATTSIVRPELEMTLCKRYKARAMIVRS